MRDRSTKETYLGDGLYVSHDGLGITLRAPRDGGDHYVVLEPETYLNLMLFVAEIERKKRDAP